MLKLFPFLFEKGENNQTLGYKTWVHPNLKPMHKTAYFWFLMLILLADLALLLPILAYLFKYN